MTGELYTHKFFDVHFKLYSKRENVFRLWFKNRSFVLFLKKKKSRSFSEYWLLIYCQNTRKFIYLFCNATFGIHNNHINK